MITEKRFTIDEDIVAGCFCLHDGTIDSVDGYVLYDEKEHCENVCDLLNKLNDENEQLKQRIKQLEDNIVNKIQIISGSVTNDSDV